MHVKLGISYQSDPHKAIDLALEAARGVARVMETPQPTCLLVAFGDSTIDFELRFWINDPANGTTNIRSAVMLKIWDLFRENGIEIPSPRRDLTFRNPEALVHAVESLRNTPDRPAAD
jgi:small-conductance mechanosensitive channel